METIFGRGGLLRDVHPQFEYREQQLRMSEFILEGLCDGQTLLIEAGTGVGKTISYLVPALLYCIESDKKLAVSTETKALQRQLMEKDIPLAREVLRRHSGLDFTFSLCLGSSNYPCRKRFETTLARGGFSRNDFTAMEKLKELFNLRETFDRSDIRISGELWSHICREPEVCNFYSCEMASRCVFQKAKKEWNNSRLLVMNHYLFYSNILSGKTYLPKFDVALFDEAQSLEDIASDQLGFDISQTGFTELLVRFHKKGRKNVLLGRIRKEKLRRDAIKALGGIEAEMSAFFESLRESFRAGETTARVREGLPQGRGLVEALKEFQKILDEAAPELADDAVMGEFDIMRGRLFMMVQNLTSAVFRSDDNFVYWMERSEEELLGDVHLRGQPVDVSTIMQAEVNTFYESSIYLSATLAVGKDFSYFAQRMGLDNYRSLLLDSPFDYQRSVVLYLEKNIEGPDSPAYLDHAARIAAEIIRHLGGNCLILFTSYRMLEELRRRISPLIDFPIYAQGDLSTAEAFERYVQDDGSILMGTHSYWQGIDLPGDLLRGVILMRLPFSVPDRPPVQARMERMEEQGQSPFFGFQVPQAILRFKQGFGRLIRSSSDRGIVAVLDPRILTKGYGRLFLNSLPECGVVYSLEELRKFSLD